jgi:hypothetical protein
MDRYCVAGGGNLRIGYRRGREVLAITTSKRLSVRGIRRGSRVRTLRRRLRHERRIRVGRNVWYVARAHAATLVFRTRGRSVLEVGLADRRRTRGLRATRRFLRSWELPHR